MFPALQEERYKLEGLVDKAFPVNVLIIQTFIFIYVFIFSYCFLFFVPHYICFPVQSLQQGETHKGDWFITFSSVVRVFEGKTLSL